MTMSCPIVQYEEVTAIFRRLVVYSQHIVDIFPGAQKELDIVATSESICGGNSPVW